MQMENDIKRNFILTRKSLERAPHYSSGSLLSKICAENAAFRKNPDRIVRAVQLCWCIQGTGASLCHHSWLGRSEILPRGSNVCHNVDHFVPSEQFM